MFWVAPLIELALEEPCNKMADTNLPLVQPLPFDPIFAFSLLNIVRSAFAKDPRFC